MKNNDRSAGARGATSASRPADAERTDLDWAYHAGAVDNVLDAIDAKVRRRRQRSRQRRAWAGGLAALALGMAAWRAGWQPADRTGPRAAAASSALVSLPAHRTLPDGSTVEFKDDARIVVEFTAGLRRVVLQNGEAHFKVAHNPQRPFVVRAGDVEVRAVGTAFSVQLGANAVDVLVTEGRVALDKASRAADSVSDRKRAAPQGFASLAAGHRVVVELAPESAAAPVVMPVTEGELVQRLAWRVPKLEFSATPLTEALPLINRYSRVQVALGDAALGLVELSGVLRADNLDTLFRLLAADHGIVAERAGQDRVVLRRGPSGPSSTTSR